MTCMQMVAEHNALEVLKQPFRGRRPGETGFEMRASWAPVFIGSFRNQSATD
jgi:hypothetical protein